MTAYKITFNGTEEQLLMWAGANGYTGYKPTAPIIDEPVEPEVETIDEFMARILITTSPSDFIKIATTVFQMRKWTENYDAQSVADAMINLISISPIVE